MDSPSTSWTRAHDLSLVFIALAHGTDQILADEELEAIVDAVKSWRPDWTTEEVQETVMESLAVYLESDKGKSVVDAIDRLKGSLSRNERKRALENIVVIAESDGLFLGSERSLVSILARAWGIRDTVESNLDVDGSGDTWGILHDIGLMYVAVAHGGDAELSDSEIKTMIERLQQWQPDLQEQGARRVLRESLRFYATQPDRAEFGRCIQNIRDSLPIPQRVALLDDLMYIAESDGSVSQHEREMIETLSNAWSVGVRVSDTG